MAHEALIPNRTYFNNFKNALGVPRQTIHSACGCCTQILSNVPVHFTTKCWENPFTDAKEIKPSLNIATRMLGDKKCETKLDQILLSNNTVARRVEELACNVHFRN